MSRFYRTVRKILRYAVDIYFYDIQSTGEEQIPGDGPLIFAANHPNSIMDTVLLGTQTDREIQYMARSGLFRNPVVKALFHQAGVIPIFRAQDNNGEQLKNNVDSFERAYETLEDGGCIGIFPEGTNSPDRQVRNLKTGTARIALATEERNDFELGVRIQPVGLNFEQRDRFLSSVLLRFGEPIDVRQYARNYAGDNRGTVRTLTDRIETDLRDLATHIDDERNRQLVLDIHKLYGADLQGELIADIDPDLDLRSFRDRLLDRARSTADRRKSLEDHFDIEQFIADAVDHGQRHQPDRVENLRTDLRRYRDHLRQVRLRHDMLEEGLTGSGRHIQALKMTSYAMLLGPVAVWGFVNNAIPYILTRLVVRRQSDEAMTAFAGFASGLIAFPLFYFLQSWGLWTWTDHSWVVVLSYLATLPIAGFFFLRWWRQILAYRDRILSRTLFRSEENLVDNLERERREIIESFDELKVDYLEAQSVAIDSYQETAGAVNGAESSPPKSTTDTDSTSPNTPSDRPSDELDTDISSTSS